MSERRFQEIGASIIEERLSDGSTVFDVVVRYDVAKVVFACTSDNQAKRLKAILDEVDVRVDAP